MKKVVIVNENKAIETARQLNAKLLVARDSGLIEQRLVYEEEKKFREVYLDPNLDMYDEVTQDGTQGIDVIEAALNGNERAREWVLDLVRCYCKEGDGVTVIGIDFGTVLRKLGAVEELGIEILE